MRAPLDEFKETGMNALTLLKNDHDAVKKLLNQLAETTERAVKTRQETFAKIHDELTVHEAIEEEIFYPALKEHPKSRDIALEGTRSTTWWTSSWARSRTFPWTTKPGPRSSRS
jgi:hemerythrin superfamily protein